CDPEKIEIILVDDQSTDLTVDLARACGLTNLKIVSSAAEIHTCRKKNALHHGILASLGSILFTTDADCRPDPNWILDTVQCFTPGVGMVIGHAPLVGGNGPRSALLELQSLSVAALSAGSAGIGFPLTCSGRNLAYLREAYDTVHGFDGVGHLVGGDDVYLMGKISRTPYRIAFNLSPLARVPSAIHATQQVTRQLRYQSKTLSSGPSVLLPALAVYIFHAILMVLPFWGLWAADAFKPIGICLLVKVLVDSIFLFAAAHRLQWIRRLAWIPLFEVLLIPYVVVVCALGTLLPTKWK
ncbi:MAG: glycosyltransferase, partial [bacterium]|nr:glycosyltransferase [bacterium]